MALSERQSRQLKAMSKHVPEMLACSPPPDSAPMEKKSMTFSSGTVWQSSIFDFDTI
jgi:hypothetical protein